VIRPLLSNYFAINVKWGRLHKNAQKWAFSLM
jgi:hypothetical protein